MRFRRISGGAAFFVAALALTASVCVAAFSQKVEKTRPAPADVEREIRAVDAERDRALRVNDVEALARVYADDFVMITASGEMRSKQDQLRDIGGGAVGHQGAPARILQLRTYGDVAVVHSESQGGQLIVNGRADPTVRRFTRVYVKTDGRWQLVATHISKVEPQK